MGVAKRILGWFLTLAVFVFIIGFALNVPLTTKQAINYNVKVLKIPLYLKCLNLFYRHFNYAELTKSIITGSLNKEERVQRILEWTHKSIQKQPRELPTIDDHIWHIIVRGYGTSDQAADVFTTLCNYAGLEAYFSMFISADKSKYVFAFVELGDKWRIFDPAQGIYMKNRKGEFAGMDDIASGEFDIYAIDNAIPDGYSSILKNLTKMEKTDFKRAGIQSPVNRFIYQLRRWASH